MNSIESFSYEVLQFIVQNEKTNPYSLALKNSPFPDVEMKTIVQQLQGRQIAKKKFPFLLRFDQYRYPKKESLEQASSEITALFKSNLMQGESFIDLTGGMGIDTFILGKKFNSCLYLEPNKTLYSLSKYNFKQLRFDHCKTENIRCEDFLHSNSKTFDWAYLDPSRRIEGQRKISIHNYEPNLVQLQKEIGALANNVLVKLSPMQDISECINELSNLDKIIVVSVRNEVKELLLHLRKGSDAQPKIHAIDLNKEDKKAYSFLFSNRVCAAKQSTVKKYIYQPSAAIVKAELQNRYALLHGLEKLHSNTQLYTSDEEIENFQGRIFIVKKILSLNKKDIKNAVPKMKANVITKNFPLSASQFIQKYKLKEGGSEYLIAFTDVGENKICTLCDRLV